MAASSALVDSGKVRALAISSSQRSPRLPDVPTVAETVIPGYEAFEWNGIFVPAGTPDAISAKLLKAIVDVLQEDEVKKRFAASGAQPIGSTSARFADYLKKETRNGVKSCAKGISSSTERSTACR